MSRNLKHLGSQLSAASKKSAASQAGMLSVGSAWPSTQPRLFFSSSSSSSSPRKAMTGFFAQSSTTLSQPGNWHHRDSRFARNFHNGTSSSLQKRYDSSETIGLNPGGPNSKPPSLASILNPASPLYQNIVSQYKDPGKEWLNSLLGRIDRLRKKWHLGNLSEVTPHPHSYNYVLLGNKFDGEPIVLKLSFNPMDILREAEASAIYRDQGSVEVFAFDLNEAAILREYIPGKSVKDQYETGEEMPWLLCAKLIQTIHDVDVGSRIFDFFYSPRIGNARILDRDRDTLQRELENNANDPSKPLAFPARTNLSFSTLLGSLQPLCAVGMEKHIPSLHLERARRLLGELALTQKKPILLHGKLSPENIRLSNRGWLATNPRLILGEPCYECIPLIMGMMSPAQSPSSLTIQKGLQFFATYFREKEERLLDWCYVRAVALVCERIQNGMPGDHWAGSRDQIAYFYNHTIPSVKRPKMK